VLLYYAAKKRKKQRAMKFGNYETLEKVAGKSFLSSNKIMLLLKMAAITSLILGISSPVLQYQAQATGSDYVIAVDTSSSMLATDLEPTRLEAAKSVSSTFTSQLSNQTEIGSLSFSGRINNKTQIKADKEEVREFISRYEVGAYAGTAIGDAVYTSTNMLINTDENRTLILITDGISNTGRSVNESIQYAQDRQVKINTIGIGESKENEQTTNSSEIQYPNLNSSRLRQISNATDGAYSTVTSRKELEDTLLNMEETTVDTELSDPLIFLALILLLGEWILGTTRFDVLP
jgi:Ca-activated chloride channel family protein